MSPTVFLSFAIALQLFYNIHGEISCKNMAGKPVDWFIVYKLPRLHHGQDEQVREGIAFYYMDSESPAWSRSKTPINATGHAVEHTLRQIYTHDKSKEVMYALYNDEKPGKETSFTYGHTKGDVCFDKSSGFWLVHSVPHLPPWANESYAYPHTGRMYGQTFLCVTYNYDQLNLIGKQMMYNMPWVYDFNMPDSFAKTSPQMALVLQNKHVKQQPWNNSVVLQSKGSQKFLSFAKYRKFDADLYDAWVAPYLGSPLYVESWQNGKGPTPSNCSGQYKVFNIKELKVGTVAFDEPHDHAKWCVTTHTAIPVVCIGDINRQDSQKQRSGGTVCLQHTAVWKAFSSSVIRVEKCQTLTRSDQDPQALTGL
ncbi:hypothetical protein NP493_189g00018 [Ridgeia piscesae]|uniref:Uncharacterized protein n=1 Tax=Ridgeia piscesae TaxID=27915 RepID=A0AAD9P258_RIDPI|nr:hypothetical protein NP493_189g00018 [Ridgeia piscesae]